MIIKFCHFADTMLSPETMSLTSLVATGLVEVKI